MPGFEKETLKELLRNEVWKARGAKHLTQEQVAEQAYISTGHYQHIEGGQEGMSLATLFNLARALEISLDNIIFPEKAFSSQLDFRVQCALAKSTDQQKEAVCAMLEIMHNESK